MNDDPETVPCPACLADATEPCNRASLAGYGQWDVRTGCHLARVRAAS